MVKREFDIAIVGGGIVGLATAFQLQTNFSNLNIVVFEEVIANEFFLGYLM